MPSELGLDQLYDVIHALMIDAAGKPLRELAEAIEAPFWNERATWGTGTLAERQHRAMMGLTGGPAPVRDPAAPRPTRKEPAP